MRQLRASLVPLSGQKRAAAQAKRQNCCGEPHILPDLALAASDSTDLPESEPGTLVVVKQA